MRDEKGEYESAVGLNQFFNDHVFACRTKRKDGSKKKVYDSWNQKKN